MTFTKESLQAAAEAVDAEARAIGSVRAICKSMLRYGHCPHPKNCTCMAKQPRKSDAQFDFDAEQEGGAQ
jgi:hypothetical protein